MQLGKQAEQEHNAMPTAEIRGAHVLVVDDNLGGEALRAVAFDMEKAAKTGNLEYVKDRLPELENQFARLKGAMNEFVNDGK